MILLLASRLLHTVASLGPETHHANIAWSAKLSSLYGPSQHSSSRA